MHKEQKRRIMLQYLMESVVYRGMFELMFVWDFCPGNYSAKKTIIFFTTRACEKLCIG